MQTARLKFLTVFLSVILVFLGCVHFGSEARAAESVEVSETQTDQIAISSQHLLPDSKLYILKAGWEQVRLFFTFSQAKKTEFEEILASRRLNEAEQLLSKDRVALAQQQLEKFKSLTGSVEGRLISMKEKGQDVSALTAQIEQYRLQHQDVLQNTYNQAPEALKEQVSDAMAASAASWTRVVEAVSQSEDLSRFRDKLQSEIENAGSSASGKVDEIKEKLKARGILK